MKVLIQRVKKAEVLVSGESIGKIGPGLLLFLGIGKHDTGQEIAPLVKKVVDLRIFENEDKKFDLSLQDVKGEVLIVSQFTLCGSCEKGRRPDFFAAAEPFRAKEIYEQFIKEFEKYNISTATGKFGAYMQVQLENDGPVTFMLEKETTPLGVKN